MGEPDSWEVKLSFLENIEFLSYYHEGSAEETFRIAVINDKVKSDGYGTSAFAPTERPEWDEILKQ